MSLTYKQGRIVVILKGRFSGCKAIIVKNENESNSENLKKFGSIFVLGILKCQFKIVKKMSEKKKIQKNKIKIFLKSLNKSHVLPTRYNIELGFENNEKIKSFAFDLVQNKKNNVDYSTDVNYKNQMNLIKNILLDRYLTNKNKWFFKKLKF